MEKNLNEILKKIIKITGGNTHQTTKEELEKFKNNCNENIDRAFKENEGQTRGIIITTSGITGMGSMANFLSLICIAVENLIKEGVPAEIMKDALDKACERGTKTEEEALKDALKELNEILND